MPQISLASASGDLAFSESLTRRADVIDNLLQSHVTLDRYFNFSVLHFPHLQKRVTDPCGASLASQDGSKARMRGNRCESV